MPNAQRMYAETRTTPLNSFRSLFNEAFSRTNITQRGSSKFRTMYSSETLHTKLRTLTVLFKVALLWRVPSYWGEGPACHQRSKENIWTLSCPVACFVLVCMFNVRITLSEWFTHLYKTWATPYTGETLTQRVYRYKTSCIEQNTVPWPPFSSTIFVATHSPGKHKKLQLGKLSTITWIWRIYVTLKCW